MARKRVRCENCKGLFPAEQIRRYNSSIVDAAGNYLKALNACCTTCAIPYETAIAAYQAKRAAEQDKQIAAQRKRDQEREEAVLNKRATEHTQASFNAGVKAALPPDEDQAASDIKLWRTAQQDGPLPESPLDRFVLYPSLNALLDSAEQPPEYEPPLLHNWDTLFANREQAIAYENHKRHETLMRHSAVSQAWEGMGPDNNEMENVPLLSFQEVRKFLQTDWNEGARIVEESMESLEAPATVDIRRRGLWSSDGNDLSVNRYLAGQHETMWRTSKRRAVQGFTRVRIVVDLGTSCGACDNIICTVRPVAPESLFWRGAAAAALAESLETAGYSVEIVAGAAFRKLNSTRNERSKIAFSDPSDPRSVITNPDGSYARVSIPNENTVAIAVVVKDFDEPLNAARLASCTASVLLTRRVILAEILSKATYTTDLGTLDSLENPRIVQALGLKAEGNVATVFVNDWVLTKVLANAWVKGTLYGLQYDKTGLTPTEDQDQEAS